MYWVAGYGPVKNGCCAPGIDVGGLGCRGVFCCFFVSLLASSEMKFLLSSVHVDGLGRNCSLLYIFTDAGGVGSRGGFVAWKFEVAWADGLVGVWFLLSVIVGSVLLTMSLVVLSEHNLGRSGVFLVNLPLLGPVLLEILLMVDVLVTRMWDGLIFFVCVCVLCVCVFFWFIRS